MGKKVVIPKRLLILEAAAGGGHRSITAAIKEQLNSLTKSSLDICHFDMVDPLIQKGYQYTARHQDFLYSLGFALTDHRILNRYELGSMINFYLKKSQLITVLDEFRPQLVFSNNQFAIQRVPELVHQWRPGTPVLVFVPDPFTPHAMNYTPAADLTMVATEEAYQKGLRLGLPPERLVITGHPVREEFYQLPKSKAKHRQKLHLKPYPLTILFGGSGDGADKVWEIIKLLIDSSNKLQAEFQAIFITGTNQRLKSQLEQLRFPPAFHPHILGFVSNMDDYVHASDLIVGKAGPNLILEAVAARVPFVATHYLSQEKGNLDYIRDHHLGLVAMQLQEAANLIMEIINQPRQLGRFQPFLAKERQTHRHAARNIAQKLLEYLL